MISLLFNNIQHRTLNLTLTTISGTQPFFIHKYRKGNGHQVNANEYGINIIPGSLGILIAITIT